MGIPVALVFTGGGRGALVGLSASYFSSRIFRSERSNLNKYCLSGIASLCAVAAYAVGAFGLQYAILSFRDPASKAALADVAMASNRDLPLMIDDATEFYEVEGLDGTLVFRYRFPGVALEEIDAEAFLERMQSVVRNQICEDPDLRSRFIDRGVLLRLSYASSDQTEFATIEVNSETCDRPATNKG
jgi:hypothetical protein